MTGTRAAIVLALGALALTGCGDDDDEGTGAAEEPAGGGAAETVSLSATEFAFTPANPSVKQAGTVTFEVKNDGQADHALEVEGPRGEAETDTIPAGESATLEVDLSEPGTYEMYCPIGNHRQEGMVGSVSVAGAGGGSAGGSEDDSGGRGY